MFNLLLLLSVGNSKSAVDTLPSVALFISIAGRGEPCDAGGYQGAGEAGGQRGNNRRFGAGRVYGAVL